VGKLKGSTGEHVSVRLVKEDIARIDALIESCSTWWRPATRSDVVRMLVLASLERVEQGENLTLKPATPYLSEDKSSSRRVK
jgi:Arc/MetJ-type ribon-helix-helix transcriptional regulator